LLKLQGLDGKVIDLSELRGSVVLVSFGATWCAPCSTELRALEEILSEYREKPVKFFWVSIERPEEITNAALRRYAKERKLSFPVLRDSAKMVFPPVYSTRAPADDCDAGQRWEGGRAGSIRYARAAGCLQRGHARASE
jgi:peroxiredoxin